MATIRIDYGTLTKEEFISIISGLKKSKYLKRKPHQPAWENVHDPCQGEMEEVLNKGGAAAGRGFYIPLLPTSCFLHRCKLHIPRFAASGKAHSFRCSSFPHKIFNFAGCPIRQADFVSQKSCICAVTHVTKSAYPTAAKKCLPPHSAIPQSTPPTPFPRQPEAKV